MGDARQAPRKRTSEQLLQTAADAFYAEGFNATGVDQIVELSGLSKPTLYAHFSAKRELLAAALQRRSEQRQASLARYLESRGGAPRDRLLAVFDWIGERHHDDSWRGCPFL